MYIDIWINSLQTFSAFAPQLNPSYKRKEREERFSNKERYDKSTTCYVYILNNCFNIVSLVHLKLTGATNHQETSS